MGKIDGYSMMIISQQFHSIYDFINIEFVCRKYANNIAKFPYNPISFTSKTRRFFPNLNTLHLYIKDDLLFTDMDITSHHVEYKTKLKYSDFEENTISNILDRAFPTTYRKICYSRYNHDDIMTIPYGSCALQRQLTSHKVYWRLEGRRLNVVIKWNICTAIHTLLNWNIMFNNGISFLIGSNTTLKGVSQFFNVPISLSEGSSVEINNNFAMKDITFGVGTITVTGNLRISNNMKIDNGGVLNVNGNGILENNAIFECENCLIKCATFYMKKNTTFTSNKKSVVQAKTIIAEEKSLMSIFVDFTAI
ncbi:hypothetical protein EIN_301520 [Entamoeba invadens IP1]|uniref:Uncharacterized protein n=1 Tax=Entamoeba invadens IP1 TaxID=370355 RepID=A0A0A1U6C4_ENTIV|nr:hypothetical protein EIN_301520 [Entamoeba invadens IP1]ELP89963.1 hypothetical protein EIN_301520 [Entamoeba invadens IP1]|eukprot:XP_004256734.1 hypothetical protein EIN_301520 [Entamoeba invadens IP1]